MPARQPVSQSQWLPAFGVIAAGPLKGWRYAFLQFVRVGEHVATDLRVTPPNWPFPTTVRFRHDDLYTLEAVQGERAKRLDALALIKTALEYGVAKTPFEFRAPRG